MRLPVVRLVIGFLGFAFLYQAAVQYLDWREHAGPRAYATDDNGHVMMTFSRGDPEEPSSAGAFCGLVFLTFAAFASWPLRSTQPPQPELLVRRRGTRLVLKLLGVIVATYGAASLTGGWLGMPPWWPTVESNWEGTRYHWKEPGRAWVSFSVVAVGLVLVALAAWPRRTTTLSRGAV